MSSSPVEQYAIINEVKLKLNISTSDLSQDPQITVATNDANNYIVEQTIVHAAVITAGDDPSLSSMANNLGAAYFNFWISTEKDNKELERWQNRIQQYIMAKYGKKSANMLSGEETIAVTRGFGSPPQTFTPAGDGDVVGPASATDNAIARYDGITGKLIQNSGILISDSDNITVELQAFETNVDVKFVPKGTGTFYGNRETWAWPLTDEFTAPTTGVKYTTEPAPYDMSIEDVIAGLTTAGTGAELFTIDVLKETSVNGNVFATIFSIFSAKITIDASEFTSTTADVIPEIFTTTWEKGRRLQLSISLIDTNGLARGVKVELITHAIAK